MGLSFITRLRKSLLIKMKVGIFSFTSCAGCQIRILDLEDKLLDIMKAVDIIHFPLIKEKNKEGPFDMAFVEGAVTTPEHETELKRIRKITKFLVSLGTCATYGGIPSMKNFFDERLIEKIVYIHPGFVKSEKALGIDNFVKVDYYLYGCPINKDEFLRLISDLINGKIPREATYPVCVECRMKENVCLFSKGLLCFGPISHGGCGAVCPTNKMSCFCCRGFLDDANIDVEIHLLEQKGIKFDEIKRNLQKFQANEYSRIEG